MAIELVTDGRSDEVGAVRVESVLHHQIDMAEINVAEVNRDLLAIRRLGAKLAHIVSHSAPSSYHLLGWHMGRRCETSTIWAQVSVFSDFRRFQPDQDHSRAVRLLPRLLDGRAMNSTSHLR